MHDDFSALIECTFEDPCPDMNFWCGDSGAVRITMGAVPKGGYALGALAVVVVAIAGKAF